jgi:hypothetical protein
MLGSGQLQAPLMQTLLPGHWSLLVQATAPPQDLEPTIGYEQGDQMSLRTNCSQTHFCQI